MLKDVKFRVFDTDAINPGDLLMIKDNYGISELSQAYALYTITTVEPSELGLVNIDPCDPVVPRTRVLTVHDVPKQPVTHIPREALFYSYVALEILKEEDDDLVDDGAYMPIDGGGS